MAYIQVDIDMSEIDTDDLIQEVCRRMAKPSRKGLSVEQATLIRKAYEDLAITLSLLPGRGIEIKTLDDKLKFEIISTEFPKYTSAQMQEKFNQI